MNNIDPTWIWIGLAALVLIVIAGLFTRGARRSRSQSLRDQFGNEYDHAVQSAGSRKRAEQELTSRVAEVEKHEIRPLTAAEQERYRGDWQRVEKHFIERPTTAVVEADELVADMMRVQGYPIGDFEKHAAHLSVKHPRVVEHYRAGHKVMEGAPGSASTEDLRQAMLHYRALFLELAGPRAAADRTDVVADVPRANEVVTETEDRGVKAREEALRADRDRDFR
jgi:FtsZ-interacting cell division protein ZipA